MYNKILVAIDPVDTNQDLWETALYLAQKTDAKLILLQIIPASPENQVPPSAYEVPWQKLKQKGLEILRSLVQEATAVGIDAEFTQDFGHPGRTICDFAQTRSVDLILIGSRGLTGVKEMFLGSVSNYVTHHAPCSVSIVRKND